MDQNLITKNSSRKGLSSNKKETVKNTVKRRLYMDILDLLGSGPFFAWWWMVMDIVLLVVAWVVDGGAWWYSLV